MSHPEDSIVLDRLLALITDCYIDRFKLKGINAKDKVPKFLKLLSAYDIASLEEFLADVNHVDDYGTGSGMRNTAVGIGPIENEGFSFDDDLI